MDMDVSCAGEAAKSCFGVFCGLAVMKVGRRQFEASSCRSVAGFPRNVEKRSK